MPGIADLSDERTLMRIAGMPIYLEGATCAEHHCVEILDSSERSVSAVVRDTEDFETALSVSADRLAWACSCGQATPEKPCPHVIAVGVTVWRESPPREGQPDDVSKGRGQGLPPEGDLPI